MASKGTDRSIPIKTNTKSNDSGFEFPLSPNEPGKFDFYRVHVNNQGHKNESMFSDFCEASSPSNETPTFWKPLAHIKHLSDQGKTSSSSAIYNPTSQSSNDPNELIINNKTLNKPIHTVASFSSLTDAVKNAMKRGYLNTAPNQLQRPANGTTLSSKDLNHLSPQSM